LVNRWLFSARWVDVITESLTGQQPSHALLTRPATADDTRHAPMPGTKPERAKPRLVRIADAKSRQAVPIARAGALGRAT
jgi:hypothetical protein